MYALIFVLFAFNSNVLVDGQLYQTKAACEVAQKQFPTFIAEHNASAENVKITHYAAVCTEIQKAPQGKAI